MNYTVTANLPKKWVIRLLFFITGTSTSTILPSQATPPSDVDTSK